jgi:hypothetical protein
MTRRKKSSGGKILNIDFRIVFIAVLLVVMFLVFYYIGADLGFDDLIPLDSASNFITILPSVFLFIVGLYILINIGGLYVIPAFGILGFAMAVLLHSMYDPPISMITPQMMSGLSIESIMFWTVIISLIFGGIIAAATSKRK